MRVPKRPAGVPASAEWNGHEWEDGKRRGKTAIGTWTSWRETGERSAVREHGKGDLLVPYKRFHPDGSLAQEGQIDLEHGAPFHERVFHRGLEGSPENDAFADYPDEVDRIRQVYDQLGYLRFEEYYDHEGAQLQEVAKPQSRRPARVPAEAHYATARQLENRERDAWVLEITREPTKKEPRKLRERTLWNVNGTLDSVTLLAPGRQPIERTAYAYWDDDDTVLRHKTITRSFDLTNAYYDRRGKLLHEVREDRSGNRETVRYVNGVLVMKLKLGKQQFGPPALLEYYDDAGRVLVDFRRKKWRLYDKRGEVELDAEEMTIARRSITRDWDVLLPKFSSYTNEPVLPATEHIRAQFRELARESELAARMKVTVISKEVKAILKGFNFKALENPTYETTWKRLVAAIADEDGDVADYAADRLWKAISLHGVAVHDGTFAIGMLLLEMYDLEATGARQRIGTLVQTILDHIDRQWSRGPALDKFVAAAAKAGFHEPPAKPAKK